MSYASEVLADSPLGYWDLQETAGTNANDQGSWNKDGTIGASVVLDETGPIVGATTKSMKMATAAASAIDVVGVGALAQLNSDFTIEFWAKNYGLPSAGQFDGLLGHYHAYNTTGWGVLYDDAGRISFKRNNVDTQTTNDAIGQLSSTDWKHFVFNYDDTNHLYNWYVNGVLNASGSITYPDTTDSTHDLGIGWEYDAGSGNNWMAHVAIYGSVLSAHRIAFHYYTGLATSYPFDVSGVAVVDADLVGGADLPASTLDLSGVPGPVDPVGNVAFPEGEMTLGGVPADARIGGVAVYEFVPRVRSRMNVRMPRR